VLDAATQAKVDRRWREYGIGSRAGTNSGAGKLVR
jgi:hypothetical protein